MQQYFTDDSRDERIKHDHLLFALDIAGIGTWDLDLLRNEVSLDSQCSMLIGSAPGEPLPYGQALSYIHPADARYVYVALQRALDPSTGGLFDLRFRILRPGSIGSRRMLSKGKAYFNEKGIAWRLVGILQDITDRVGAAEKAIAAEYLAEAALNNTRVGLFWINLSTNAIEYSPAFAAILTGAPTPGLSREHLIKHIHPEDIGIRDAAYTEAAHSGDLFYECRTIWDDGMVHWIRTVGRYSSDREMFSGTIQNITVERQLHLDVASAQRLAELAIRSSGMGVFHFDLIHDLSEYSPAFAAILTGAADRQGLRFSDFSEFVHPDDQALTAAMMEAAMQTGEIDYEPHVVWADGSVHRIHVTGACIFDKAGRLTAFSGTVKDISEQDLQSKALMEAEEQFIRAQRQSDTMLRNITNSAPTGLWLTDTEGTLSYINDTLVEWTGLSHEAMLGDGWAAAVVVEDAQQSEDAYQNAVANREHYDAMFRMRRGDGSIVWCRAAGDPYYDDDGRFAGYAGFCMDIDELVKTTAELKAGELRFRSIVEQAPMAIGLLTGRDMIIEVGNGRIFELWGKDNSITGQRLKDALPEIIDQGFIELLEGVFDTGEPFFGNSVLARLVRNGRLEDAYFDFAYTPLRRGGGVVSGVMVLATEVTEQVMSRKAIEESEARFRSLIEEAPFATALYSGRELIIETANEAMIKVWGKDSGVVGKPLRLALPELEGQPFLGILDGVFTSGIGYHSQDDRVNLVVDGALRGYYFNFTYKPLRDGNGSVYAILNMAVDVTDQVMARKKVEESELFARSIIDNSPVAELVFTGADMVINIINQNMLEMLGRDASIIGKPFMEAVPELRSTSLMDRLLEVFRTGQTHYQPEEKLELVIAGQLRAGYYNYIYKALRNTEGEIYGVITTATEVTDQVLARQKIEEAEVALRGAVELAELGTWAWDVATGQLSYSERMKDWFGFQGEETFRSLEYNPLEAPDLERVREAIAAALQPASGGIFDVEYHVTAYRTGKVRIIHAQGKTLYDDAGKPLKLTGTARDVTEQRQLQLALEQLVQQRTEELAAINEALRKSNAQLVHSNEELAQYAYVASHDLQEPLRKIRMFSGMLESRKSLLPGEQLLIEKITQSSERMSMLINDLLDFSRLLKTERLVRPVDLNEVIEAVVNDFELTIQEKGASVHIGPMPVIQAISLQMNQLFYNLLGNALKFSKPGLSPVIEIRAEAIGREELARHISQPFHFAQYHHISIRDNGIGFEVKYAEQIFEVFKRLHGRELYPGSGIGLALCRRIIENHHGILYAESTPGKGTTFHLILPDRQQDYAPLQSGQSHWV